MAKQARKINNKAVDVTDGDVSELFHATVAAQFISVPDDVVDGSEWDGNKWLPPQPAPQPAADPEQ